MVAIINSAVLGNHGIHIDWLATSEETILASKKYGKQLEFQAWWWDVEEMTLCLVSTSDGKAFC